MQLPIQIPFVIHKVLSQIKHVDGILLTGSRTIGKESKNADWDFHVLLRDGSPRWRRTMRVGNTWLELFCYDREQIRSLFEKDRLDGRGKDVMMFATGMIVQDTKKGALGTLVQEAKKIWKHGPARLSKIDIQKANYFMATMIQDIEDCVADENAELLLLNQAVNDFVRYYYRLMRIWMPRPKDRLSDFAKREPALARLVRQIHSTNIFERKASLAMLLGRRIGRKFHLSLDGCIYMKPGHIT